MQRFDCHAVNGALVQLDRVPWSVRAADLLGQRVGITEGLRIHRADIDDEHQVIAVFVTAPVHIFESDDHVLALVREERDHVLKVVQVIARPVVKCVCRNAIAVHV